VNDIEKRLKRPSDEESEERREKQSQRLILR
jgi:hypothetical protein